MESVTEMITTLRRMGIRQLLGQGVQLGLIITSALMIWKTLLLVTGSESPVVVVLSGSMEPGFYRGDILFLKMGSAPFQTGEVQYGSVGAQQPGLGVAAQQVVVFNIEGRDIPIVHRVIKVHDRRGEDKIEMLTKGDNNFGDDWSGGLYAHGQQWLNRSHIMGRAVGYLPNVGYVTIMMNDYPKLKYLLIGVLGLLVITNKDA